MSVKLWEKRKFAKKMSVKLWEKTDKLMSSYKNTSSVLHESANHSKAHSILGKFVKKMSVKLWEKRKFAKKTSVKL